MINVDWAAAEVTYVTKHATTYGGLAKKLGVAKSTVVRHALKESWPDKRKAYSRRRIKLLEEKTLEGRIKSEERQLGVLRVTQAIFNNEIVRLGLKQQRGEIVSSKEWRDIAALTEGVTKSIFAERVILGLPTKPVRISDEQAIEDIKMMMGYTPEPVDRLYKDVKETIESVEQLIERQKRLQSYIDEVDKRGSY